ncbi:hypothetical protein niasHT_024283 [Heterodera trifolii]|uniref:Effector protein n=1 Tax=Heterodera trifolii TaxID=157864 RepID=A0ABD2JM60_9BILA
MFFFAFIALFLLFPPLNQANNTDESTAACCHKCYVAFRDCFRECLDNQSENLVCVPNCKIALGNCSTDKCGLICPRPENPEFSPPEKYDRFY